jgi:hypothetical protein
MDKTEVQTRKKDRKKENKPDYKESSQDSILKSKLDLTRKSRRENSELNFALHLSTVGSVFLKIQSFLVIQMLHDIMMIISIKKVTCKCRLILLEIC